MSDTEMIIETETETQPEENMTSIKRKGRPPGASNNTNYHWHIREKESGKLTSFRTLKEVREVYGLHRGTAYLIVKNPQMTPRKYSHIEVEKRTIHQHLVPTEQKYLS